MKSALFVDRDGVINKMVHYSPGWDSPQTPHDVSLVQGIVPVIRWANSHEIPVIEISNQPGVAKAKMTQVDADAIEEKVHTLLRKKNAYVDERCICQHHPEAKVLLFKVDCECRKPKPGMILSISKKLNIYLSGSLFLGDKASDVEAGQAAGVKTILYEHLFDEKDKLNLLSKSNPDFRVRDLGEVLIILEKHF